MFKASTDQMINQLGNFDKPKSTFFKERKNLAIRKVFKN